MDDDDGHARGNGSLAVNSEFKNNCATSPRSVGRSDAVNCIAISHTRRGKTKRNEGKRGARRGSDGRAQRNERECLHSQEKIWWRHKCASFVCVGLGIGRFLVILG